MKTFKTIEVIKYPRDKVWRVMRDQLPEIARLVDDSTAVTLESREEISSETVRVVNVWQVDTAAIGPVAAFLPSQSMEWTDYAEWDPVSFTCRWHIKSHFAPERVTCQGITSFETAIAGRGTRVTIAGEVGASGSLNTHAGILTAGIVNRGVEAVALTILPTKFRKLVQAAARYLDACHRGSQDAAIPPVSG